MLLALNSASKTTNNQSHITQISCSLPPILCRLASSCRKD